MVVQVRTFEPGDTAAAVAVVNQCCQHDGIGWRTSADTMMQLSEQGVQPLRHWFVAQAEGSIIGFAPLFREVGSRLWMPLWVLPSRCGIEVEKRLSQAMLSVANDFSEPVLDIPLTSTDQARAAMLTGQLGFHYVRSWWRMRVDLSQALPPPAWPTGIHPRTFVANQDELMLTALMNDAFSEHWGEGQHTLEQIQHDVGQTHFDPDLLVFAEMEGRGVGYVWTWINREVIAQTGDRCAFISDLGVTAVHRRRGLGRALLLRTLHDARDRGMAAAELEVDGPNASAKQLYESAGFREKQERLWFRKELGSGG